MDSQNKKLDWGHKKPRMFHFKKMYLTNSGINQPWSTVNIVITNKYGISNEI